MRFLLPSALSALRWRLPSVVTQFLQPHLVLVASNRLNACTKHTMPEGGVLMKDANSYLGLKGATAALAMIFLVVAGMPVHAEDLIVRAELQRHDVSGSDTLEVVVMRLEVKPGGRIPRHTHPGEEFLYVVEGGEMTAGNGNVIPFKTGATAVFPRGMVHGGLTNTGDTPLVAVTTYVVDKGKPLTALAE